MKGDDEFAGEIFASVRVPRDNLLGERNCGWRLANMLLAAERFATAHPRRAAELFEARRFTVGSGSVEIQRNIVAKRVLELPP